MVQNINKDLRLCEKYWLNQMKKNVSLPRGKKFINVEDELYGINTSVILSYINRHVDSDKRIIAQADKEFKKLNPLKEDIVVWRGISPSDDKIYKKLYSSTKSIQEGDIVLMRQYAFSSLFKSYAKIFSNKFSGILLRILIPKGARVSKRTDFVIFPRYSEFICTKNLKLKDGGTLKYLKYILPE